MVFTKNKMKVELLQKDLFWADPEANIAAFDAEIDARPGADLYVLPEMFTTGFATRPEGIAEDKGLGLKWMKEKAASIDAAIAGSIATLEDGKYFNRFYFVTPDRVWQYDKHHLFTYGHEDDHFTAGIRRVIAEWRGVRFRLAVCYDLRFPVWLRNEGGAYDALIVVASWPTPRADAWKALIRARAIENQCYVIAVNRTGEDPSCKYSGDSALLDAFGMETTEIDMASLEAFREKFPVLGDADKFEIQ